MLVGLISDTHGLMRADALAALHGVELILHAGDVGGLSVLRELQGIAPVHAVYGNVDDPLFGLPQRLALTLGGLKVHVSHGHELGSPTPEKLARQYTADIIVFGHTHKPVMQTVRATLVVNPGAAGPRRFSLQPSVALLTIANRHPTVTLMNLRE
ncbi:metallophosphoesterase family protein [soil metagenome]